MTGITGLAWSNTAGTGDPTELPAGSYSFNAVNTYKRLVFHVHDFSYTADGATLTAVCAHMGCTLSDAEKQITISAPANLVWDGTAKTASLSTGYSEDAFPDVPVIIYYSGNTELDGAPKDPGTYTAVVSMGDAAAKLEFTIAKAASSVVKAPAANTLTYNGSAQELVTAGEAIGGTMKYAVTTENAAPTDEALYSASIPTGTDAGTWYVWYKVAGDENHQDTEAVCIEAGISRADLSLTVSLAGWTYGAAANTPGVTGNTGNGYVTYAYKAKNAEDGTYSETVPTDAGAYTVKAIAEASANYNGGTAVADFTIGKAAATITAKDQSICVGGTVPTLSGEDFYTVTGLVGTDTLTTSPTLTYQKDGSAAAPDNTTAGTYDIVPSGAGAGDNYTISYTNGTLTINAKQTQTITASDVTVTYGDTGKSISASVTDPAAGGGAISYAVKAGSTDYIDVDASTGTLTIKAVPADGKAWVTVTAAETETYAQATKDVTVTIGKAAPVVTAPTAKTLTYTGSAQELVNAGSTTGGTLYYAVTTEHRSPTDESLYTTDIPNGINVGTYYVWYKVVGDENYKDTEAKCLPVKILSEISVVVTFKVINGFWDDGTATDVTVTLSGLEGGILTEEQIPAVGNKPAENCKAGAWDVTPSPETVITKDITYTYTYEKEPEEVMQKIETEDLTKLPESLKEKFSSLEDMEQAMLQKMTINGLPVTKENTRFYDMTLLVSFDGGENWEKATAENFPESGLKIVMDYPEGTNKDNYDFAISHVFTMTISRLETMAGEIETPKVTKTDNGIEFKVMGLSPVALAWMKIEETPTATPSPTPVPTSAPTQVPKTGDVANPMLWLLLVAAGLIGILTLSALGKRKR